MSLPANYTINYYRGDTYSFILNPKNADGTDFILTGYVTNKFSVISMVNGAETLIFNGTIVVNTVDNYITCTIPAVSGANLVEGTLYYYDVQISNGPDVRTLLAGQVVPTNDISGRIT